MVPKFPGRVGGKQKFFPYDATAPWTGKTHRFHGATIHLKTRRKTTMKTMRKIHACIL